MKRFLQAIGRVSMKLLWIPPVVLGGLAIYFGSQNTKLPERVPEQELARVLRVIEIQPVSVIPRATGYGLAQPAKEWEAIAEVSGRVVELHPELEAGSFIEKNELLVRLDKTDIELAIDRLKAEIESSEATLSERRAKETNLSESLRIAKRSLEISERELARDLQLVDQGAGSLDDVDSRKRSVNTERNAVQNIINDLNLLPSQIKSAEAAIRVAQANLGEQERNLDRCEIHSPFACRLGPVELEIGEYIASGTSLLKAQSTASIEVEAQFTARALRRVIQPKKRFEVMRDGGPTVSREIIRKVFDVSAEVHYGAAGIRASRPAVFERIREELDSQARTVGIVVSIDKPYEFQSENDDEAPPPVSGTYCEVELRSKEIGNAIVIPRSSVHENAVFVLDDDNRLKRQPVVIRFHLDRISVVESGLSVGDAVVVSDPTPAIPGMLVSPVVDESTADMLRRESSGESRP